VSCLPRAGSSNCGALSSARNPCLLQCFVIAPILRQQSFENARQRTAFLLFSASFAAHFPFRAVYGILANSMRPGSRVTSIGLIVVPDPADSFVYPSHIDPVSLESLPPRPGVYFFRDRRGKPIYIGKSVNIRHRVFSHLRTPQEAAMLAQSRSVDCVRTAGEIGALLLESQLIKQWQPEWNVLLRHEGEAFAIGLERASGKPRVVGLSESEDNHGGGITMHGLFASRGTAQEGLRQLIRQHGLCPVLTGLEMRVGQRACFAHQLGQCRGACAGVESLAQHSARLRQVLDRMQREVWPWDGPIGIVEECEGWRQTHVVDRWSYLGSLQGRRRKLERPAGWKVDMDVYKILSQPARRGELRLQSCVSSGRSVTLAAGDCGNGPAAQGSHVL
jgi:excinuclease Cho